MRTERILAAAVLAWALGPAAAHAARVLPGAAILDLGLDAKSLSMGEAALAQGRGEAGGLHRSPLGLFGLKEGALAFSHGFLAADVSVNHAAYARRWGGLAMGFSLAWVDYGSMPERDATGSLTGQFSPRDMVYQVSAAKAFGPWEAAVSAKMLESRILGTARAYAVDAAVRTPVSDEVQAAVILRNFGKGLKFESETAKLPTELAGGLSWTATSKLKWNLELAVPFYAPVWTAIGAQYTAVQVENAGALSLRAGANTRNPDLGGLAGFHAGFGLDLGSMDLSYSYDPFGDLGTSHRLSVGYRW